MQFDTEVALVVRTDPEIGRTPNVAPVLANGTAAALEHVGTAMRAERRRVDKVAHDRNFHL